MTVINYPECISHVFHAEDPFGTGNCLSFAALLSVMRMMFDNSTHLEIKMENGEERIH